MFFLREILNATDRERQRDRVLVRFRIKRNRVQYIPWCGVRSRETVLNIYLGAV